MWFKHQNWTCGTSGTWVVHKYATGTKFRHTEAYFQVPRVFTLTSWRFLKTIITVITITIISWWWWWWWWWWWLYRNKRWYTSGNHHHWHHHYYQHLPQQPAVTRRQRAEESSMWSTVWGPSCDVKAGSEQFVDCGIFIWGLTFWNILELSLFWNQVGGYKSAVDTKYQCEHWTPPSFHPRWVTGKGCNSYYKSSSSLE